MSNIFEEKSKIEDLISNAMENIKTLVETNTIIGDPVITPDNTTIIPVSKVSVGFVVGGGEYADVSSRRVAKHYPMAGGSAGGMSVMPVGFLIESNGEIRYVNIEDRSSYQTILNIVNTILDKVGKKNEE